MELPDCPRCDAAASLEPCWRPTAEKDCEWYVCSCCAKTCLVHVTSGEIRQDYEIIREGH